MVAEEELRRLQAELERAANPPSENADAIDKAREFTAELKVILMGRDFPLRKDGGLIALLRYGSQVGTEVAIEDDVERGNAHLGHMYSLLSESIQADKWASFERWAIDGKAQMDDIEPCVRQVIEAYTARPYWPGMRLLATAADNIADFDGSVLAGTGRGIASYSAREVCNLMFAKLMAMQADGDARVALREDIYLDYSPEAVALDQVRQMIASKKRRAEEEAARAAEEPEEGGPDDGGFETTESDGDRAVEPPAG